MTRGAGTCWQQDDDDGFQIWLQPPRDHQKPFTDSERAQRWRLSLASLLFLTILLSDHLWFCAEAKLARTRDKFASSHLLLLSRAASAAAATATATATATAAHGGSLRANPDAIFIGNSSEALWRLETTRRGTCLTFADADQLCRGLSVSLSGREAAAADAQAAAAAATRALNMSDLYLSFCNSYSLLELLRGASSPDNLNCSLDVLADADPARCSLCVQAYQRYDQHAQEKYDDFELLTQKYEPGPYSVRTCMERCKRAYKPWLCGQYFPRAEGWCERGVGCGVALCLEVQQSCPFILPDNDDLIHGGSPSFVCTGLLRDHPSDSEAQCCDVRWDSRADPPSGETLRRTASSCRPEAASATSAAAPRACGGRLKICLLALVLLHTVIVISASHNATALGVAAAAFSPEETASNEE